MNLEEYMAFEISVQILCVNNIIIWLFFCQPEIIIIYIYF